MRFYSDNVSRNQFIVSAKKPFVVFFYSKIWQVSMFVCLFEALRPGQQFSVILGAGKYVCVFV